jgi:hypothetical protein
MSGRLPWFRCFPSDLLGAMSGLSAEEGYVYVAALLRIYETGGPAPETVRSLSRRTGLAEPAVATALDDLMAAGKLVRLPDGRLDSPTTHAELAWQQERRSEQVRAGQASAARRARPAAKAAPPRVDAPGENEKSQSFQQNPATGVEPASNQKESREQIQKESPSLRSGERPRPRASAHPLPDDWLPSEEDRRRGTDLGFTAFAIDDMAEDLRLWARGAGALKHDWGATFVGWMRRESRERPARGGRAPPGRLAAGPRRPTGLDVYAALALEADDDLRRRASC